MKLIISFFALIFKKLHKVTFKKKLPKFCIDKEVLALLQNKKKYN